MPHIPCVFARLNHHSILRCWFCDGSTLVCSLFRLTFPSRSFIIAVSRMLVEILHTMRKPCMPLLLGLRWNTQSTRKLIRCLVYFRKTIKYADTYLAIVMHHPRQRHKLEEEKYASSNRVRWIGRGRGLTMIIGLRKHYKWWWRRLLYHHARASLWLPR